MQRANNFFKSTKPRREHAIALFVACNRHGEDKRRRGRAKALCFSTCHGRYKDEKPSVFMEQFRSSKKSDGFQGQSEAQPRYAKRNIPRVVGSCEHCYDLTASP